MGLQNASLAVAPTSVAPTGGTAKTFAVSGEEVKNGIVLVETSEPDPRLRKKIVIRTIAAKLQPDGSYSKERRFVKYTVPRLAADGITVLTDTYKYESGTDASTTSVVDLANRLTFCQVQFDADFESFHTIGSLY